MQMEMIFLIITQKIIKADLYFQIFITAPLLSIKTINNCIELLKEEKMTSILTDS